MIPVYMINGFLESGKTEFIKYTIAQPYFQSKNRTLLIMCEEGEVEYDFKALKKTRTDLVLISEEEDFTIANLKKLEAEYQPSRIVIEYNGMWNCKDLVLPENWSIEQQITTIDASTFPMYFTNMKSMVAEMVRKSEMIIFNRCDGIKDLASYKRNVKAVNPQAEIIFEDANGEVNATLEEELPYDLNAEVIKLDDLGFGIWYLDIMENFERYIGKTVEFVGQVLHPKKFPKDYFVPGRLAMTCCADDMAFLGYACHFKGCQDIPERSFVRVTAEIKKEYFADYRGEGPVLYASSVVTTKEPKNPIIDFS